tara:strand:+ start:349 stop:633 length:285 start_codon:yes stop_codon:yes gene_type:complete
LEQYRLEPQGSFFFLFYLQQTMPAHRRFQIKDKVNKRKNTSGGVSIEICSDVGEVISIREKKNKKGTACVYCTVRWEKDNRTSEHAQHMLLPCP